MRKLVVNSFLTLDGVMQAPGGPQEDPSGGFEVGGWSVGYWDELMGATLGERFAKPFDLLLGRKTYEIFAAHWPHIDERAERGGDIPEGDSETAVVLNNAKKYVASRTLDTVSWNNSELLEGDAAEAVTKLKEQPGPDLHVHGSANLIQTLLEHGLVDEFSLMIFPVVVGRGKRLFDEGTVPAGLKLVDSKVATTGVIVARYEPAGEIRGGSFAFENPTDEEIERREKLAVE